MNVFVQFTTIGTDAGPFNLYSNVDGFIAAFETGVTRAQLLSGYPSPNAPNGTSVVKVKSFGVCNTEVNINVTGVTTTTSTSTTTTTTTAPPSMVFPVQSCCNGSTGFIAYNSMYGTGSTLIVTTMGIFDAYVVTGLPIAGVPNLFLYDGTDYDTCANFLAVWAGNTCLPFP